MGACRDYTDLTTLYHLLVTVKFITWLQLTDTEALKPYIYMPLRKSITLHISESVSDDYLQYMLLQFPTNVTGWVCHTLVTSSLLKVSLIYQSRCSAEVKYCMMS
jgi:hypothetical protein